MGRRGGEGRLGGLVGRWMDGWMDGGNARAFENGRGLGDRC